MFSFRFDTINVALLVMAALNLLLGVLISVSGRHKKINIVYSVNIIAIIGWIVAMFFYRSAPPESALAWCTALYVMPTLIASSFLYFTYIFPTQKEKNIFWRVLLIFGINLALIAAVVWPGLMIKEVNIRPGQEKEIIFSSYYWFYFLYTLSFFSFGFYRLFRKYFGSKGIERLQIIYLVTGYALAANLAFITNLIMPWIGQFGLNWLGQVLSGIMVACTAYAIIRYRLMDIRVVFRKAMIFFLSAAFTYGSFYLVIWLDGRLFGGVYAKGSFLFSLAVAPLFVLLFVWVNESVKGIADRYLFFGLYSIQETMAKLTSELSNSIDLSRIIDSIVNSIKNAMQLDRAAILLIVRTGGSIRYEVAKTAGFERSDLAGLTRGDALLRHLESTQKPLVREELAVVLKGPGDIGNRRDLAGLASALKRIEASLCLPMIISNKLIGAIVLGEKVTGDAYTSDDLKLLDRLSKQASIAVDNARLYKQVQDFSRTLEQKVAEQTKEIRGQKEQVEKSLALEKQAHDLEHHANEELRQLDASKTEFMSITQHHLRTPLTINAGLIDLLLTGAFGRTTKKMKDIILRLKDSNQKEIEVVNELLDVSSYQIGKETVHLGEAIDVAALMEETLKDLRVAAENKGLRLKYGRPKGLPKVPADRLKLKLVLTNVIDNCIKYTEKGGVTITLKAEDGKLRISVADTGIGLTAEVIKNLFKRTFHRGQAAQRLFAEGRGLGLYLSAKIIEGHHGRIWAESPGPGKGSVFHIELPLTKDKYGA